MGDGKRRRGNAVPDAEVMAKQQRCLDYRATGKLTYAEIAEIEGYESESGARAAVEAALRRAATEAAAVVRPLMIDRAERMFAQGYAVMMEGRDAGDMDMFTKGAAVADRSFGRLMKLHNLDVEQVSVNLGGGGELDRIKQEFAALMEGNVVDAEIVPEGREDEQDS
ncbi:hypothetical protein [Nocardia carnea]|uniref:hypothetical protein n=1 Tax=Nocardia carnea TaxID=37328 RepID=UPI00245496A9|nr:hypothetical protein [Nocardia carnea]